jgi:integrase
MLAIPMAQHTQNALTLVSTHYQVALQNALRLWAEAVTSPSSQRRHELLHYKQKVVDAFFAFIGNHPAEISPLDVEHWRDDLKSQGLKPTTIYTRICFLSSFFEWALRTPALKEQITRNPVRLAMPKAPKPYQTESTKSWTDDELQKIVEVVRAKAEAGEIVGKRDYALLLFYLITGMRRQEVIGLRGRNLKLEADSLVITSKVKGGDYVGREVRDESLRAALLDYLSACDRTCVLKTDGPLWTRHDRAGKPGAALSSHSFVKNLKQYGRQAGVGEVHLHQTRHSYARIIAEESGSITDTQDALGHRNAATTRIYVQRIAVKKDKYSESITRRIQRKHF